MTGKRLKSSATRLFCSLFTLTPSNTLQLRIAGHLSRDSPTNVRQCKKAFLSMSRRQHVIHHTLPPLQFVLLGLLVLPRPRHPDYQGDPRNPGKRRFLKPFILRNTKIYFNFQVAQVVQLLTRRSQGMVLMCAHAGDVRQGHLLLFFFSSFAITN